MDRHEVEQLAQQVSTGKLSSDQFVREIVRLQTADLGDANLDLDRRRRCGFPEVIYGEGKTVPVMAKIFNKLLAAGEPVLATRISGEQASQLAAEFPAGRYNELGRTFRIGAGPQPVQRTGHVAIVTAGTSDLPVAEEARETLDWMGVNVTVIYDVGVAGPHRLPIHLDKLEPCDAVVVVAGAEGALPSVVGGFLACPVIGVPTSVGYGANFGGIAALLSMLNSCASNVTVVNIDAGFKGAYVAGLIAHRKTTTPELMNDP